MLSPVERPTQPVRLLGQVRRMEEEEEGEECLSPLLPCGKDYPPRQIFRRKRHFKSLCKEFLHIFSNSGTRWRLELGVPHPVCRAQVIGFLTLRVFDLSLASVSALDSLRTCMFLGILKWQRVILPRISLSHRAVAVQSFCPCTRKQIPFVLQLDYSGLIRVALDQGKENPSIQKTQCGPCLESIQ